MMTMKNHLVLIYRIYLRRIKRRIGILDMERLEEEIYGGPRCPVPTPATMMNRGMVGYSRSLGRILMLTNTKRAARMGLPRAVIRPAKPLPEKYIANFVECAKKARPE